MAIWLLRLTADAVEIVLPRSKARTEPATVLVPCENNPGLVAAVERWIAEPAGCFLYLRLKGLVYVDRDAVACPQIPV